MFTHNVEIVQSTKQLISGLPFVRSQRFDDSSVFVRQGIYDLVAFVSFAGEEITFARRYWKISVINQRWTMATGQSGRQNIKAASNCVNVDACFDLEGNRKRFFFGDDYHIVGNVSGPLSNCYVDVIAEPSVKSRLKRGKVGFSPINRRLGVEQIALHFDICPHKKIFSYPTSEDPHNHDRPSASWHSSIAVDAREAIKALLASAFCKLAPESSCTASGPATP